MRKSLCLLLVVSFLVVQAFAGVVLADSSDAKAVLQQVNSLSDEQKGLILQNIWDYAIENINDGVASDVENIYNKIEEELVGLDMWDDIIAEDGSTLGDGKLAKESLKTIIQKLLNNKEIIVDYYNVYEEVISKEWVKLILGVDDDTTEGEVFVALLDYSVEVFTLNSNNEFVRYGDVAARMGAKLGTSDEIVNALLGDVNSRVDQVVKKLNNNIGGDSIRLEDAIFALELYNLYKAPSTDDRSPSGGGGGGATTTPSVIDQGSKEIDDISKGDKVDDTAAEKIADILDKINESLQGSTDRATSTNISSAGKAIKNTVEAAKKADSDEAKEQIITNAAKTIGSAAAVAQNIKDETSSIEIAGSLSDMIGEIGDVASGSKEMTTIVASEVKDAVKAISSLLENVSNHSDAVEIANNIIESAGKVVRNTENAGKANKDIEKLLVETANKVIEKLGSIKLGAQADNGLTSAVIDSASLDSILEKASEVVNTANTLNDKLQKSGINGSATAKVILDVDTTSDDVNVEFPAALLSDVKGKGIEKIEISSAVASIAVEPDFLGNVTDAQTISIQSRKVDTAGLPDLSEEQMQMITAGAQVYDFNVILRDSYGNEERISNFNKKVTVSIPYTLKAGENKDKITVLYLADDGTVKNMVGRYDVETGMVIFETSHFSKYIVKSLNISFSDISSTFWAADYIESMAAKGIISGRPNGEYDPQGNVTRAEFAKMITVVMGIVDQKLETSLVDVESDAWYAVYVASAENMGIISGYTDGTFRPDGLITREEMASMVFRALGQDASRKVSDFLTFEDNSEIATWARTAVSTVVRDEIITGKPENKMDPKGNATRAEAAAIIYRFFNY